MVIESVDCGNVHCPRGQETGDEIHVSWRVASGRDIVVKGKLCNDIIWRHD